MDAKEFCEQARRAFRFLSESHGFRERRIPRQELRDQPFQVCFENATTTVSVLGIHWGYGVEVRLASVDPVRMREKAYYLDDLLEIRAPELLPDRPKLDDTPDIQRALLERYAAALERHGADVLDGNFAVFPRLAAAIAARRKRRDETR